MKDFDYEKFIDNCEYGYELQKNMKYLPVIKYTKKSFFRIPVTFKWYNLRDFHRFISISLGIYTASVYIPYNLDLNKNEECNKFIIKTIWPNGDRDKLRFAYMSIEEYKTHLKNHIKSDIEYVKKQELKWSEQEQKQKEALNEFNKTPYKFKKCD